MVGQLGFQPKESARGGTEPGTVEGLMGLCPVVASMTFQAM